MGGCQSPHGALVPPEPPRAPEPELPETGSKGWPVPETNGHSSPGRRDDVLRNPRRRPRTLGTKACLIINSAVSWFVFLCVIAAAAIKSKLDKELDNNSSAPSSSAFYFGKGSRLQDEVDQVFRFCGPALPFLLFVLQCFVLPFRTLLADNVLKTEKPDLNRPGHSYRMARACTKWLKCVCEAMRPPTGLQPNRWTRLNLIFLCDIYLVHLVIYFPMSYVYAPHHVFLATSLIAQVQMTLTVSILVMTRQGSTVRALVVFLCSWLLLLCIFYETYFHTTFQDAYGCAIGILIFSYTSYLWAKILYDDAFSKAGVPLLAH